MVLMSLLRITKQTVWRPFADDLNIERGIVRGWVVFIPRSAEIQPIVRGFYKQRIPNSLGIHLNFSFILLFIFYLISFFIPSNYNFGSDNGNWWYLTWFMYWMDKLALLTVLSIWFITLFKRKVKGGICCNCNCNCTCNRIEDKMGWYEKKKWCFV